MHIGIDYTPAYEQGGGIGRLTRDLVTALAKIDNKTQYRLFVAGAKQSDLPNQIAPNFKWKPTSISPKWLARIWHRTKLPLPIEVLMGQIDLFHATDFTLPPTLPSTRTIVTVHDLSFVRVSDTASPKLKNYLDKLVPRSISNATHIIADSQATKNDLIDLYDTPSDKITVLLSGIDSRYHVINNYELSMTIRNNYNIPNVPYIFSIGTIQPRKNYSRLIQALKILRDSGYDLHLVIAGGKGWLEDEMYKTLDKTQLHQFVHLIGFADDEDVVKLYNAAECIAFPSLYEGFGFPVLEGMACGTPVLTSNVSSLPEVAGDAAIMVDPYDVEAIAEGLKRIVDNSNLRETLIARGLQQASKFTWENSAKNLLKIYQNVLES